MSIEVDVSGLEAPHEVPDHERGGFAQQAEFVELEVSHAHRQGVRLLQHLILRNFALQDERPHDCEPLEEQIDLITHELRVFEFTLVNREDLTLVCNPETKTSVLEGLYVLILEFLEMRFRII